MTEAGGPTTQAGIRYQDRVAALYLGRMLDCRERPRRDRPVEVRVETLEDVDDFLVCFDDGAKRYFQVKLSLERRGKVWKSLWLAFHHQLVKGLSPDDRLVLILGEPSVLASNLKELAARTGGAEAEEWLSRLTTEQRLVARSIAAAIGKGTTEVLQVFNHLDLSVWPANELERDYVPLWMPTANTSALRLFEALVAMTWAGSVTRSRFEGAAVRERLSAEWEIAIGAPTHWGLEGYRNAIVALAKIEVPGTGFKQAPDADFLWPRCLRYDRVTRSDFDDDLPGWRDLNASEEVNLQDFPNVDLRAVVIVAGPGFGKSALLNAIARKTALAGLVPAVVPMTKLSDSGLTIADYLEQRINTEYNVRIDWRAAAATGKLVLLLDGLDEVSSDRRTLLLERLKVYCATHSCVQWALTVRDAAALAVPSGATAIELAPLTNVDIPSYVAFYRPGEPEVIELLSERTSSRTDLSYLTRIPIFLALMLVMRLERADLTRSDLLETYIETLFRPAAYKRTESETINVTSLRRIAELAAFKALETDSIGITNHLIARCVKEIEPNAFTDAVQEALVRRGVLRRSGLIRLTFPFPIVQEYLASTILLEQTTSDLLKHLSMIFRRPWAQAIQFALERHSCPEPLVQQILSEEDDVFHSGLRLLGRCLANGMAAAPTQRETIGDRLAAIWGRNSWRTNKLVNGIIVDAFSRPLHPAVRARLGERPLIYEGSGTIVALHRDTELTMSVLRELLTGDIYLPLNIGELQEEVNRIGTKVFELYVERCRQSIGNDKVEHAISCLIGHMRFGSIDVDVAYSVAIDSLLPSQVRLAAWSKSDRKLDEAIERLIMEGILADNYHLQTSAAQALSSPMVDVQDVAKLLGAREVPLTKAEKLLDYLICDWRSANRYDRVRELLTIKGLKEPLRDLALLYSIDDGNLEALDDLVDRFGELDAELVSATVLLLGHAPERRRVERIVSAIADRTWSADDRVSIADAFATGLTHRMKMFGLRSGTLERISFHPGRNVPHELLKRWLTYDDYNTTERLKMTLNAVQLGITDARRGLRPILDAALAACPDKIDSNETLISRAIEILHADGNGLTLAELEQLVRSRPYNLAARAAALIAAGGSQSEANSLIQLYGEVSDAMLRLVILSYLEPLASRRGVRVIWNGDTLSTVPT